MHTCNLSTQTETGGYLVAGHSGLPRQPLSQKQNAHFIIIIFNNSF